MPIVKVGKQRNSLQSKQLVPVFDSITLGHLLDCAGVILGAAERATQVALQEIQCLGGNVYVNEYSTGRLLRDAKL
ncbi:hypothetical protein L1887_09935 [Cichorium endivia]|nr:hypothetical protein L1887_09935 [Cichorium endivia]